MFMTLADLHLLLVILPRLLPITRIRTIIHSNLRMLTSKLVHIGLVELPRTNLILKHDIQLSVRPILVLWKHEEHEDSKHECDAGEEESGHASPVPVGGRQHPRNNDVVEDAADVVDVAGQDDRLDLQARGGRFGDDGVADGPNRAIVCVLSKSQQDVK